MVATGEIRSLAAESAIGLKILDYADLRLRLLAGHRGGHGRGGVGGVGGSGGGSFDGGFMGGVPNGQLEARLLGCTCYRACPRYDLCLFRAFPRIFSSGLRKD